jgi:hypothetical protein
VSRDVSGVDRPYDPDWGNFGEKWSMNKMHLVLFDMQIRMFGPYLAAIHRILASVV